MFGLAKNKKVPFFISNPLAIALNLLFILFLITALPTFLETTKANLISFDGKKINVR
jgi:fumarate reductase subunit C